MVFPTPDQMQPNTPITVATAGEALMDMIQEADGRLRPCDGGAVYNLTRALGLQGVGTLYLNPLSQDRFGRGLAHAIAQARGQTLSQMAVNWLLRRNTITSILIGASKVSQIEDIVGGLGNLAFSEEELSSIERVLAS